MAEADRGSFLERIAAAPRAYDAALGAELAAGLAGPLGAGPARALVEGAAGCSPYLARLLRRHGNWLAAEVSRAPEASMAALLAEAREVAFEGPDGADALRLTVHGPGAVSFEGPDGPACLTFDGARAR
ncbi:MAG: hypothetical protein AAFV49_16135, partial [Pseudomonadota bacterium]